jgi:sodium transport system ATP-binding protein
MIHVQHLSKTFASTKQSSLMGLLGKGKASAPVVAVADVSFSAPDGQITGLLGPNGAGKTTSLRMIAGLITPDAGTISVDGVNVLSDPQKALARMGVLSDARGLYPRLSARENIIYYGALQSMNAELANQQSGRTYEDGACACADSRPAEYCAR